MRDGLLGGESLFWVKFKHFFKQIHCLGRDINSVLSKVKINFTDSVFFNYFITILATERHPSSQDDVEDNS